jgi:hypothetical protein
MLWIALTFVLFYSVHPMVGFGLASIGALAVILSGLLRGVRPRVGVKDALYFAYAWASALHLANFPGQFPYYAGLVLYPWLVSFFFQNVRYSHRRVGLLVHGMLIGSLAISTLMVFQTSPGELSLRVDRLFTAAADRNAGFVFREGETVGPNVVAFLSAAVVVLLLASAKYGRRAGFLSYLLILFPAAYLMSAGGRMAWIGTAACIVLFLVLPGDRPSSRWSRTVGATLLVAALGAVVVIMYDNLELVGGAQIRERASGLLNPTSDATVRFRQFYWALALRLTMLNPIGWGFNDFYERYGYSTHNELLGQLVGAGWLAALLFVVLFSYLWIAVLRSHPEARSQKYARFLLLCLLLLTSLAMLTENVSRVMLNTYYPLLWVAVGMFLADHRSDASPRVAEDDLPEVDRLGASSAPTSRETMSL